MSAWTRRQAIHFISSGIAAAQGVVREPRAKRPYLVLAACEDSEASLSKLAQELESKHGMRCNILVASSKTDLPGLDALEDAHTAVFFLDSLALRPSQLNHIRAYVNAAKPLVALRTTTRAFDNWPQFGQDVLGAPWRHDYGNKSSTDVSVIPQAADHPILKGVAQNFHCRSWLYHVLPIASDAKPLLMGKPAGETDRADRADNPVAWTRTRKGAHVFYTSLGHPEDFDVEPFRRLLINAIYWALNRPSP